MKLRYSVLSILIACLLFNIGCSSAKEEKQGSSLMNIPWKLTDYIILPNATWGKSDANKLIFKEATISENSISFNNQNCKEVIFKRSPVSLGKYLSQKYHISIDAMKLKEQPVTQITTNCHLNGFSNYLQLADRRIIIFINGVAFFLVPAINY